MDTTTLAFKMIRDAAVLLAIKTGSFDEDQLNEAIEELLYLHAAESGFADLKTEVDRITSRAANERELLVNPKVAQGSRAPSTGRSHGMIAGRRANER